jgi:hypothetical protein
MREIQVGDWVVARRPLVNPREDNYLKFYEKIGRTPFRILELSGKNTPWAVVRFPDEMETEGRITCTVFLANIKHAFWVDVENMYADMRDYA